MKTFKFILFIICICFSNTSFSQSSFVKAHVIDNNQQRIDGSIDFGLPMRNPDKIIFLDSSTLQVNVYKPSEIQSFAVELPYERRYESRVIHIPDFPKYVKYLNETGDVNIITDTVFVEVLVKGYASLYSYKDEKGWEHFFSEKNGDFQTLIQRISKTDWIDRDIIIIVEKFKNQLRKLFVDCPDVTGKINALENKAASLKRIFTKYNACKGYDNEFVKDRKSGKKNRQAKNIAINLGYRYSMLNLVAVNNVEYNYIENLNFSNSQGLPIGISYNLPLSKKNNHLSLYNELTYVRFTSESNQLYYPLKAERFRFRYQYFRYSAALRYRFGKEAATFSPFVNIGGNMSYGLSSSSILLWTNDYINFPYSHTISIMKAKRYPIGGIAGFGLKINRFSTEIRMEYTNGLGFDEDIETGVLSAYVMFAYQLAW